MDDLISRSAAIEAATDWHVKPEGEIFNAIKAVCRSKIEQIPAVDAVPVKHAKWDILVTEHFGDKWQADAICSCCELMKFNIWSGYFPDIPAVKAREITNHYASKVKLPKYCEYCGAKMKEQEAQDDRG